VEKERTLIPREYLFIGPAAKRWRDFNNFFEGDNKLPFPLNESNENRPVVCGHFYGVCEATVGDKGSYAIKVHHQTGETGEVFKQACADRGEYEKLKELGFGPFLAPTHFLVGHGLDDKPAQINVQPWIDGKPLGEKSLIEIMRETLLIWSLKNFIYLTLRHFFKTGELIDYLGFGIRHDAPPRVRFSLERFSVFASRNLIWDGRGLFLIDPTTHQRGLSTKDRGKRLLLLGGSLFTLLRDYLTVSAAIKKRSGFLNEAGEVQFRENIREVISKLEELRERGLDYRVVGGLAAAAILKWPFLPFRSNGSKRDLDILVLNPNDFEEELKELERWANERAFRSIFSPFLSLHKVGDSKNVCFQVYFSRGEGENTLHFSYGDHSLPLPPSSMKVEFLEFDGIRFPSFPRWFHYFLYLTRNFGYIRGKDRQKVNALKKIALATEESKSFYPSVRRFLKASPHPKRVINTLRLKLFWFLGQ